MSSETQKSEQLFVLNGSAEIGNNKPLILICNVQPGCSELLPTPNPVLKSKINKEEKMMLITQKREEREKARAELKEKKEAEKLAKTTERKKKEEERRRQREKEDQEKKEKRERKEAERKRKLDEFTEKQEAKRRKETEKKEKEMVEEEKKKKEQNKFRGFFVRSPKTSEHSLGLTDNNIQQSYVPVLLPRQPLNYVQCNEFDLTCSEQNYVSNYLSMCKQEAVRSSLNSSGQKNPDGFKLLQFSKNHRPPYWGTWRKKSRVIRSRAPFNRDEELLEYGVDSDEEWEEEEPGESLSDSEIEEEDPNSNDNEEDEDDGFFVPHGYLSEDEGDISDGEISEDNRQHKQLAKAKAWEAEFAKKCNKLISLHIGIVYGSSFLTSDQSERLKRYAGVPLCSVPISLAREEPNSKGDTERGNSIGCQPRPVPEAAMPDLIRLVHKNQMGLKKLVDTFREHWAKVAKAAVGTDPTKELNSPYDTMTHPSGISKRQLEQKISSIATKEVRPGFKSLWYVSDEVLNQYKMSESNLIPFIHEAHCSPIERRTPQGMKDIKQFFKTPGSKDTNRGSVARSLSLTDPPPIKKRRVSLTSVSPVLITDSNEDKENLSGGGDAVTFGDATTRKGVARSLPLSPVKKRRVSLSPVIVIDSDKDTENDVLGDDEYATAGKGIDWQKQLLERSKISVSIDIHI